jgi:hypothetical protein
MKTDKRCAKKIISKYSDESSSCLYSEGHDGSCTEYGGCCYKCHGNNEPYMLKNRVWNDVVNKIKIKRGLVCLQCVEEILGRQLKRDDFTSAPINRGIFGFHVEKYFYNTE